MERLNALRDQAQKGEITGAEVGRKRLEITAEGLDPLTAAKYFLSKGSIGSIELEVGREYAERAFSENPDSVEALHVWVLCHDIPQQEAPFRRHA